MEATWALLVTSVIVAVSVTGAVKLLNFLWIRPRKLEKILRKQGLDGNRYRPFIGDIGDMTRVIKAEQLRSIQLSDDASPHILAYDNDILNKYGKNDLLAQHNVDDDQPYLIRIYQSSGQNSFFWFGPWPRLNIVDPELINDILRRNDVFHKPLLQTAKIVTSGITLLEGEKWAQRRKIINPAFHVQKLKVSKKRELMTH